MDKYIWGQLMQVFIHLLDEKDKRKENVLKLTNALNRVHFKPKQNRDAEYYNAADIIEYAITESWKEIPEGKQITINAIAWLIYKRHESDMKHYKLNIKHLEKMSRQGVSGHAFDTIKVLNTIEKHIEEKINESKGN